MKVNERRWRENLEAARFADETMRAQAHDQQDDQQSQSSWSYPSGNPARIRIEEQLAYANSFVPTRDSCNNNFNNDEE